MTCSTAILLAIQYFLNRLYHQFILLDERDTAYDYRDYWITVQGWWFSLHRPQRMGSESPLDPFVAMRLAIKLRPVIVYFVIFQRQRPLGLCASLNVPCNLCSSYNPCQAFIELGRVNINEHVLSPSLLNLRTVLCVIKHFFVRSSYSR